MTFYRHIILPWLLLIALTLATSFSTLAQTYRTAIVLNNGTQEIFPDSVLERMNVIKNMVNGNRKFFIDVKCHNGKTTRFCTDSIKEMNYGPMTPYEHFAGDWYLVASPVGEPNSVGIMVSSTVSIPFHAVLPDNDSPDYGKYVYCHIDSMAHRKGLKYPADFKMRYQYNPTTQAGTISLILDDQHPVTNVQYAGDESTYAYLDDGITQYFGNNTLHQGGDNGGRHMFFVSENIETHNLEGMELTASWTIQDQENLDFQYLFPTNYHIFWIVSFDIPFINTEHDAVGYIDIFSSARVMRNPWNN